MTDDAIAQEPAPEPALTPETAPRDRRGRAAKILEILDRHYPDVDSFLDHGDPYQLLVAVILSAQCTDARVNLVTPALFARAPNAATMGAMEPRELERYIRTCGLAPAKAANIIAMSQVLAAKYRGLVPNDLEALEALPGIGHKTASVVLSQAYGAAVFPVDTHIHRLAGRWQLSRARNVEEVERDLKAVFPVERWNTLHLQLIEFGRAYCTAKKHLPASCPVCSWAMSKRRATAEVRHGRSKPNIRPKRRKPVVVPKKPKAKPVKAKAKAKAKRPTKRKRTNKVR